MRASVPATLLFVASSACVPEFPGTGSVDMRPACGVLQLTGGQAASPSRAEYNPTSFTLEAWIRPTSLDGYQNLLGHWGSQAGGTGSYALYLNGDNPSLAIACNGMTVLSVPTFATIAQDQWTHVAATFDASTTTGAIYVNGQPGGSTNFGCSPLATTGVPVQIAYHDPEGGRSVQGMMDDARLSSVVRYTAAFTPPASLAPDADTLALFRFEGSGSVLTDESSLGNAAVATGNVAQISACR